MATQPPTGTRPVRLRGLWTFLGSTALAVVVAFFLAGMDSSGGRARAVALALPFVGMVTGLLQLITGRRISEIESWFARVPLLARVPLGCLGAAGLLLACGALVAAIWTVVSGIAPRPKNAWIYVDNGGERPAAASVDGGPPVTVGPGSAGVLKTTAGTHTVTVRDGSTVVYEGQKTFAPRSEVQKYVLNPDRTQRYVVETVYYGSTTPRLPFAESPEWAANRVLERVVLLTPDPWVAGAFDEVFDERPPETVKQRRGEVGTKVHKRLCRVAAADHALVAEAIKVVRAAPTVPFLPSPAQASAIDRVRAACPQ